MAREQAVNIRVGVKDADRAIAALRRVGVDGERALKTVARGGPDASKALAAVDAASRSARAGIGGLVSAASAAPGPLGSMAAQASMLGGSLRGGGGAALALAAGVTAATAAIGASIGGFAAYQREMYRLEAQIKATGGTAGVTAREIEGMAQRLGDATLTSAAAVRQSASALLSFRSIGREIFEETLQRAQDVSEVFGTDLRSSAVQLGKALDAPIQGVSALREAGVTFSQSQVEMIRALVETGRQAEAQRLILDELARQVGGAGVGAAGGLAGVFDTAGEEAMRLAESLGGLAVEGTKLDAMIYGLSNTFREFRGLLTEPTGDDLLASMRRDLGEAQGKLERLRGEDPEAMSPERARAYAAAVAKATEAVDELRQKLTAEEMAAAGRGRTQAAREAAAAAQREAEALADQATRRDAILAASAEELRLAKMKADERVVEEAGIKAVAEAKKKEIYDEKLLASIEADARETARKKLDLQKEQAEAAKAEAAATAEAARAAADLRQRNEALDDYIAGLETEVTLAGMGTEERERHVALLKAAELVQRQLTEEEAAQVSIAVQQRQAAERAAAEEERQAAAARRRRETAQQEERRAAEEARRDWEHTGDRIVDFFSDAFAQVRSDGTATMQDLADDVREALTRTLSQISMEVIVRPIVQSLGSGGGLSGLSDLAPRGMAAAGSASQSSITSAIGAASALFRDPSTFGTTAWQFGASNAPGLMQSLGLAQSVPVVGPGSVTTAIVPTAFGSHLAAGINASPYGAIGTFGAQMLGFESRNPYVGAGLGIAGSIGGGALGAAALGTAVGGPIGAVAGAFLAQVASSYLGPNASVGPNESAYLGLEGNRFQVGGSGQDNGGNAARAAAVVQQAADALNALVGAAGLRVADPSASLWRYGVGTPGVSPYSATSAEQLVAQVIGSGRLTADDPNVAMALGRTSGTAEQMMVDLGFAADFEDALRGMQAATLDYAEVLEVQARRAVEDQVEQLQDFRATTERLGLDTQRADTALRDYVRTMLGLRPEPETLTPVEEALTRMRVQWEALGPLLDEVGISAGEAEGGLAKLRDRVRQDFVKGMQAEINEARGLGVVNSISAIIAQAAEHRRSAVASGADTSLVDEWLQSQIAQQLSRADEAGVLAVLAQLGQSPVAVSAAEAALADLRAEVTGLGAAAADTVADLAGADRLLRDEIAAGVREMADAARAAADAFGGFATSLGRDRQDILVGDLSPLSALAQLDTARARVEALRGGIASGDQVAYQELQGAVASFLTASRQYNASGIGYTTDFNLAQDLLTQAEEQARAEEARQRAVQDAALRQVDELRGIRGVLDELSAPLVEFARLGASVLTGQAGGASAISAQHALLRTMSPDELAVALGTMSVGGQGQAYARSVLDGRSFSDPIQAALRQDFSAIGSDLTSGAIDGAEAMRRQLALYSRSDLETLQHFATLTNPKGQNAGALQDYIMQLSGGYAHLQGYAMGGIVSAEGAYRLAEGGRPEAVVPLPDGRTIPVMMQGGGDSRALRAEVAALRQQVAALTRVVAAGSDRQVEALGEVAGNTGKMARAARIAGARS